MLKWLSDKIFRGCVWIIGMVTMAIPRKLGDLARWVERRLRK